MDVTKKIAVVVAAVIVIGGLAAGGLRYRANAAADGRAGHPLIGTWMVDTDIATETDAPEIGIFTADGSVFGLGATRWVSGAWDAADASTGTVTMAGVFAANGGGYAVLRGPHEVDATGDAWTCDCTFTVVAPDGTVLASGRATAHASRLPIEPTDAVGMPLGGFPTWAPAEADATPAA